MPLHLNAYGIDQHKTAKPPCGIAQGHRRRDPAAHRGANDQDITQVEPFQEVQIGKGKIINTIEPLGRGSPSKPGWVGTRTCALDSPAARPATVCGPPPPCKISMGRPPSPSLVEAYGQTIGERFSACLGR